MSRLDIYRTALLAADPAKSADELREVFEEQERDFAGFVIDHGLGPMWHERTGREEFRESRLTAEALFLTQQTALRQIDEILSNNGIDYVVVKGAANRLLLYDNPAIRACHDLDILVRRTDRMRATSVLSETGFDAVPERRSIGREIVLQDRHVVVDLHWTLLRSGRLRHEFVEEILAARRRVDGLWIPNDENSLFLLVVHPAFAKYLAGWDMGLHRVADVASWLTREHSDPGAVVKRLTDTGVRTAAWATLRWTRMLLPDLDAPLLTEMLEALRPGPARRKWLDSWLRNDWHSRLARFRRLRLLAFSSFLHDSVVDLPRAAIGRFRDRRRADADLAEFRDLSH